MRAVDAGDTRVVLHAPPAEVAARPGLLRGLLRDRTAVAGLVIVTLFVAAAVLAPVLAPHDPNDVDVLRKLAPPSADFGLGTDHLGRDILSRLLHGARLSLGTAVVAAVAISILGVGLGLVSGYFGGVVDAVVGRVVDVLLAVPSFFLALALVGLLGVGLGNIFLAMIAVWWAGYARIVRGSVLSEREKAYVEAARAAGASDWRIIRRHLLPNVVAPIVVLTTLDMGAILLGISALSFVGLGVKPPTPEWGSMLSEARYYLSQAPRMMLYPGGAIFLAVLGFNLLGDGLRDVLDPRTRHGSEG